MSKEQTVCVLLATHNGQKYLRQQIDSVLNQEGVNVELYVSDDNSSDETIDILNEYERAGKLVYTQGIYGSAQANFYNLINTAPDCEYYALCDQDDYWKKEKLNADIEKINKAGGGKKVLYYGISSPVDRELHEKSSHYEHHPVVTLESALIASNAQGCTMVFDRALREEIRNRTSSTYIMHDGWLHKTCLAIGGTVVFDNRSYMLYRLHENNVFAVNGKKMKIVKAIKGKWDLLRGKGREERITSLIQEWRLNYDSEIPDRNKAVFELIEATRHSWKAKMRLLFNDAFRSSYVWEYLGFIMLVIRGRL